LIGQPGLVFYLGPQLDFPRFTTRVANPWNANPKSIREAVVGQGAKICPAI
jgi:malate/lactate dehydrogenase